MNRTTHWAIPAGRRRVLLRLALAAAALTVLALASPATNRAAPPAAKSDTAKPPAAKSDTAAQPLAMPGSERKATLLGVEGKGSKFVYVFDRSGSMGVPDNKPINRAKAELLASINALDEMQQFYIIFYNHEQKLFKIDDSGKRLIFANDTNKELAKRFVDNIEAGGATRHFDALMMALRLNPDVIFMLTDGDPPDDLTPDELARIERFNSGTVIHVIQISPPPEHHENLLVKLAKDSRGTHTYVDFNKIPAPAGK